MKWKRSIPALILTAALSSGPSLASDHRDGPAVNVDPSTDINDVYSWMSADGTKVYLIMTVYPAADKALSKFSDAAYYVFHTASRANFFATTSTPLDVICGFNVAQRINCWVGNLFVAGDASKPAGLASGNGKVKVYAGARKDHFYFNLIGFNNLRATYKNTSGITYDANGCPQLDATTSATLVDQLKQDTGGGAPVDFFKNLNTLAIVLEIDKTLLTTGGSVLSVWGATRKKS